MVITRGSFDKATQILNTTDEQIIARFQVSGDTAALEVLIERHLERVRNLAYRFVLCHAAADDVAQEVFLKVMRSAQSFRGEARFSTWLYRITLNTAREQLRKKSPRNTLLETDTPVLASEHHRPDGEAMQTELLEAVERALGGLSDKLRAAIVLTAIEGLPAKAAAEIEGCSTATMHWRIHAARKQLKHKLDRHTRA